MLEFMAVVVGFFCGVLYLTIGYRLGWTLPRLLLTGSAVNQRNCHADGDIVGGDKITYKD